MKVKMNIPDIRFPEFNAEWTNSTLGALASFSKGKGISKADISENGMTECIRYGELYTHYNELINQVYSKTHIAKEELVISEAGDVIIPASGESEIDIATASCVLNSGIALSGDLNIIRSKLNGIFLAYYLNNARKIEIARLAQGISVVHLYASQLKSLHINYPQLPEQQKIADFLSAVDERIRLLQEKKAKLEQYKKGVMQKLFPKAGQTNPELRFKDDDGNAFKDWEEIRLGELAKFSKGKGISKADISENGNVECIRYGELYTHYNEQINEIKSRTNGSTNSLVLSRAGDVILPSSGETAIDIATAACITKSGVAIGGDINILRTNINGVFLSYLLNNNHKNEIARLAQGISVIHLYAKELSRLRISIPRLSEQNIIADFINKIDISIYYMGDQIKKTQSFKKGLLQKMFV